MRLVRITGAAALLLSLSSVSGVAVAKTAAEHPNLLAVQLIEGDVDLVNQEAGGYLPSFGGGLRELGIQVQWCHFLNTEYAVAVSGGLGWAGETDKPGGGAPPLAPDFKYTQSSWQVRVGGDRWAHINDRFALFAGPGIQIWSGKWKTEAGATLESENTTRLALEGRLGFHLKWTDKIGAFGQLGHYIGHASAEQRGAKAGWWSSGHDGAAGVVFTL